MIHTMTLEDGSRHIRWRFEDIIGGDNPPRLSNVRFCPNPGSRAVDGLSVGPRRAGPRRLRLAECSMVPFVSKSNSTCSHFNRPLDACSN